MTDQSKPTTEIPDVIYVTQIKSTIIFNGEIPVAHGLWCSHEGSTTVEYQRRADLVPAAPTGNKARVPSGDVDYLTATPLDSAMANFECIEAYSNRKNGWTIEQFDEINAHALRGMEHVKRAALKENTAPDDLVKALETMIDGYGYCSYISDEEKQQDPDIIFATKILKAYKLRTKGGV